MARLVQTCLSGEEGRIRRCGISGYFKRKSADSESRIARNPIAKAAGACFQHPDLPRNISLIDYCHNPVSLPLFFSPEVPSEVHSRNPHLSWAPHTLPPGHPDSSILYVRCHPDSRFLRLAAIHSASFIVPLFIRVLPDLQYSHRSH